MCNARSKFNFPPINQRIRRPITFSSVSTTILNEI